MTLVIMRSETGQNKALCVLLEWCQLNGECALCLTVCGVRLVKPTHCLSHCSQP